MVSYYFFLQTFVSPFSEKIIISKNNISNTNLKILRSKFVIESKGINMDKRDKKIIKLLDQNARRPFTEIAEELGVSISTVRSWMEQYGIEVRNCHPNKPDKEKLRTMYWREGMTQKEIAKKFNVSQSSVYFWMKKYRIPIKKCIDNLTWPSFSKNNTFLKDYITKSDSIEYVKNHSEVELFVLSWPYMDDCAYRIWNNMYDGQYLLYIGEPNGGATADHQFFNSISGSELICQSSLNLKNAHLSFPYIYDEPILLKKEGDNQ